MKLEKRLGVGISEAIPCYKHAIELDPIFALAYARLGAVYGNIGEDETAADYVKKAFERKERANEREKFYISSHYLRRVTYFNPPVSLASCLRRCRLQA